MEKKIKILVPYDFSAVAEKAVSQAVILAEKYKGELYFLNIVSKSRHIQNIRERLQQVVEKFLNNTGIKAHVIVDRGNIFDGIGEKALEIGAKFIVMGTHGAKGIQKITGSHVLRVICDTEVPYIIVQDEKGDSKGREFKNIISIVTHSKKSKQTLAYLSSISRKFNAKVHLLYEKNSSSELNSYVARELKFATDFLNAKNIESEKKGLDSSSSFIEGVLSYAREINADLISMLNTQDDSVIPDLMGSRELRILTNQDLIPVMIINPIKGVIAGGIIGS